MQALGLDIKPQGEMVKEQEKRSRLRYVFLLSIAFIITERVVFFSTGRSVYLVFQFIVIYFLLIVFLMNRNFEKAKLLNISVFLILSLILSVLISTLLSKYQVAILNPLIQFFELGVLAIFLYVLLANYWADEDWASLAKLLVVLATISSVTIITDFFEITRFTEWLGFNLHVSSIYIRAGGILGEVDFGAGKLGVMLPFCFFLFSYYRKRGEKRKSNIALIASVPIIFAIFLAGSRMGMLAVLFTLIYGLFYFIFNGLRRSEGKRGAFISSLAFVTIIVVLVMLQPIGSMFRKGAAGSKYEKTLVRYTNVWTFLSTSEVTGEASLPVRVALVKLGIKKLMEKPITGYGLGVFTELSREELGRALVAHNTFIGMLVETGLVGGLSFIGLCAYAFYNILKSKEYLGVFYQAFIISAINLFIMLFFASGNADRFLWGMFIPISMYLAQRRNESKPSEYGLEPSLDHNSNHLLNSKL